MAAVLRIDHFARAANEAYATSSAKYLRAVPEDIGVDQLNLPFFFSSQNKELNSSTWKIFRESLIGTIGKRKFDWICHRYQLNFVQKEVSGQPLLPEHVEAFSVGAAQIVTRDIKKHFPGVKISSYSREELTEKMRRVQPFPIVCKYKDPVHIWGSPSSLAAHVFHDKLLMDKEKQLLFSDTERLSFPAWQERFVKATINRELLEGQLIPAPGSDGRIDYYKVYRKIAAGDGLVAYALRPATCNSSLKPFIGFRPSQVALSNEDAIETYLNDVQPNIGQMGWTSAKHLFEELMKDPHFRRNNEKIAIAGYSLGGAHAQYFLADHADHVSHAVFYNDPSIDNETAERFAQKMNQMPCRIEPLNIQIYRMEGDICDCAGEKHIGWGVEHPNVNIQLMRSNHENDQMNALLLHSHRIFDNTQFPYHMRCIENTKELFEQLDNSERGIDILWYEKMRRLWGTVAFYTIRIFARFIHSVSHLLEIKILRRSSDTSSTL